MANTKITITADKARQILAAEKIDPAMARNVLNELTAASTDASPWWVVVLKTLAYLIGLLLAGYGTTAAACTMFPAWF